MTTGLSRRIQSTLLIGSALMLAACASTKTGDAGKAVEPVAGDTTRIIIPKGKFETPPEIQPASIKKASEAATSFADTAQASARINQKEAFVNVRSAPSPKSKSIAVLKAEQPVEILESKDSWVKIAWQSGNARKLGWVKKVFVEGN